MQPSQLQFTQPPVSVFLWSVVGGRVLPALFQFSSCLWTLRPLVCFLWPGSTFDWWMKAKAGFSFVFMSSHILCLCVYVRWVPSRHFSLKNKKNPSLHTYFCVLIFHSGHSLLAGLWCSFSFQRAKHLRSQMRLSRQQRRWASYSPDIHWAFFFFPFVWVCMFPYKPINVSIFPKVYNCLCGFTFSLSSWIFIRLSFWSFKCCEGSSTVKYVSQGHVILLMGRFVMVVPVCSSKPNVRFRHLLAKIPALLFNSYFLLTIKWSQIKQTGLQLKCIWSKPLLWCWPNSTLIFLSLFLTLSPVFVVVLLELGYFCSTLLVIELNELHVSISFVIIDTSLSYLGLWKRSYLCPLGNSFRIFD